MIRQISIENKLGWISTFDKKGGILKKINSVYS